MAAINVDTLAMEIMKNLEIYTGNTVEDVDYAVKVVAREAAAELRDTSPVGTTGDYSKSWSYKRSRDSGKDYMCMVVYSKKPDYAKTHLLEDGHYAVNESWVSARPHIRRVEEMSARWLEDMLTKNLKG